MVVAGSSARTLYRVWIWFWQDDVRDRGSLRVAGVTVLDEQLHSHFISLATLIGEHDVALLWLGNTRLSTGEDGLSLEC